MIKEKEWKSLFEYYEKYQFSDPSHDIQGNYLHTLLSIEDIQYEKIKQCVDYLIDNSINQCGWGLMKEWKAFNNAPLKKDTIYTYTTTLVAKALLRFHKKYPEQKIYDICYNVSEYIKNDISFEVINENLFFWYSDQNQNKKLGNEVLNVNSLAGAFLLSMGHKSIGKQALDTVIKYQKEDGGWPYILKSKKDNDLIHLCLIIDGLIDGYEILGEEYYKKSVEKSLISLSKDIFNKSSKWLYGKKEWGIGALLNSLASATQIGLDVNELILYSLNLLEQNYNNDHYFTGNIRGHVWIMRGLSEIQKMGYL
jgi:hypothetical protein